MNIYFAFLEQSVLQPGEDEVRNHTSGQVMKNAFRLHQGKCRIQHSLWCDSYSVLKSSIYCCAASLLILSFNISFTKANFMTEQKCSLFCSCSFAVSILRYHAARAKHVNDARCEQRVGGHWVNCLGGFGQKAAITSLVCGWHKCGFDHGVSISSILCVCCRGGNRSSFTECGCVLALEVLNSEREEPS